MELRVKKARIGIDVSACAFVVGSGVNYGGLAAGYSSNTEALSLAAVIIGSALAVGGLAGMIASGVLLHRRKRELRELQQAHYGPPRRVQWELARSRLVF
jgi:hypothetical protein